MSGTTAPETEYLFVYGTLRKNHRHPIASWLSRHSIPIGTGRYRGVLYAIGNYPGAVKSDDERHAIVGDLYRLDNPKTVLEILDRYEECSAENPPPHEYVRIKQPVVMTNGETIDAWIYLYNRPVDRLKIIRSGDYLLPKDQDGLIGKAPVTSIPLHFG